jgi:hypothetical protein
VLLPPDPDYIRSLTEAYAVAQESASPSISVPMMARLLSNPAANNSAQNFPVDAVLFDMGQMALQSGFMDASVRVAANEVLGGSGSLDIGLFNSGIVSPGYSPGMQTVASFAQDSTGTLLIELGGNSAGTGYDQINVTGSAILDGTLAVDLWGGFVPTDGQTFTVMTYGGVTGKFSVGSGLLKTNDGVFFEVTQGATSLTLTAHTVDPSLDFVLKALDQNPADILGLDVSQTNQIGEWLNYDYFQDLTPVTFSGALKLGDNLTAEGGFTLGYSADKSLTAAGASSAINTNVWSLSANNLSAFLGVSGQGLNFGALSLDLAFVQGDTVGYGWVMGQGNIGTATATGVAGLSLSGSNLALDFNWGYGSLADGSANNSLLNLSTTPITVGGTTFNANGSAGEYVLASGSLTGSVGDVSLTASVGVSVSGSEFVMVGNAVTANLAAGGMSIGVSNGAFGLVSGATGLAFEASGGLALTGGGFASFSADSARVAINRTGVLQTGKSISFGGSFGYTFADVSASSTLQAVGVRGLQASLGSNLTVGGNFAFEKDSGTNRMLVVASGATAQVAVGNINLGVSQANLGLSVSNAGRILEARGAVSASLGSAAALTAASVTLRLNETAIDASNLTIAAAGQSYTFDSGLTAGIREFAVIGADLTVAGFVKASGALTARWAGQPTSLTLADGTTRSVNQLWVAGTGLNAAVGANLGQSGFVGLQSTGLEFVLGLFSDIADPSHQWSSLSGTLMSASMSGMAGITLAANALALTYNSATSGQRVADFSGSNTTGITIGARTHWSTKEV